MSRFGPSMVSLLTLCLIAAKRKEKIKEISKGKERKIIFSCIFENREGMKKKKKKMILLFPLFGLQREIK